MADAIHISIVHALLHDTWQESLTLPAGTTAWQALQASTIQQARESAIIKPDMLGMYGKRIKPDTILRDGDRIEILRPLQLDPKEARRRRVARKRKR